MTTPNLNLPEYRQGQSFPNVPINIAFRLLDAMAQARVENQTTNAPPATPNSGSSYIIGPSPTGEWVGKSQQIAVSINGSWYYVAPGPGIMVYDKAIGSFYTYSNGSWSALGEEISVPYALQYDQDADPPSFAYLGQAVPGTSGATAAWRIQKLIFGAGGDISSQWADGNANFDNIWNNRASLSYT